MPDPQDSPAAGEPFRVVPMTPEEAVAEARHLAGGGREGEALSVLHQVVAGYPTLPDAVDAFREILIAQGESGLAERSRTAAADLRNAADLSDAVMATALNNLGPIYADFGWIEAALATYREAVSRDPNCFPPLYNLASLLGNLSRWREAIAELDVCTTLAPLNADVWYLRGNARARLGDLEGAAEDYRAALRLNRGHVAAARQFSDLRAFSADDIDPAVFERVAVDTARSTDDRAGAGFALSRHYEKRGDYAKAFEYLALGNHLWRETVEFDPDKLDHLADRICSVYEEVAHKSLAASEAGSPRPIFIVGMPRSGTTLIDQVLASHSAVFGAGELAELPKLIGATATDGGVTRFPENFLDAEEGHLQNLAAAYRAVLRAHDDEAAYVSDKLPLNAFYLGYVDLFLPDAVIVHCRRDPVDTCLSCYRTLFPTSLDFTFDLYELGRYYRTYDRIMDFWRNELPGRFIDMVYEEFVDDQEGETRRLLDHCGFEWEDACLDFHLTERQVLTASVGQVRQPVYRDSVKRWERYREYLQPLFAGLGPLAPTG